MKGKSLANERSIDFYVFLFVSDLSGSPLAEENVVHLEQCVYVDVCIHAYRQTDGRADGHLHALTVTYIHIHTRFHFFHCQGTESWSEAAYRASE